MIGNDIFTSLPIDANQNFRDREGETNSTEEEAEAELMDCFNSMNLSRIENGDEPDEEPDEFVMKLEDYVEGHKTIWTGEQT